MRLFLVRHAVTPETGAVLTGRLPGVALSDEGVAAAEARAEQLAELRVDALFTSPIQRCRETAAILGRQWGLRPRSQRGFIEADYGKWSGRTLKSLYRLRAWQQLMETPSRFVFPDGEGLRAVQTRSVDAVEQLGQNHRGKRVVVVSHADVIRAVVGHYLGSPLDLVHRLSVRPLSVSIVDVPGSGATPRVPVVNAIDALEGM